MQQFRVGIVGCGEAAQILHLPSLVQLSDKFKVTALCDVSKLVVEGVGDTWNVPQRFLDYNDLIKSDVDIVVIANPNAYHAEIILAAVNAGKHVLVEKPMCMTYRENDAIIAARDRAGVTVQVGHMRRYAPAFVQACKLVRELDGGIRMARVHDVLGSNSLIIEPTTRVIRGTDIPQSVKNAGAALNDKLVVEAIGDAPPAIKTAYNLMLGLSTHDLSAMRELLGVPQRVLYAAQRQNGFYMTAAFDYGPYVCHYETGIDNIARFDAHLEVYAANQTIKVVYDTPYVRNLPIRLIVTEANGNGVKELNDHPTWGDTFTREWEVFYDNIVEKRAPKTSPEDFRQDLDLFTEMIRLMR